MNLIRQTGPTETPISLTDVKAQLRISNTASDTLLAQYIAAATGALDGRYGYLGRALVTQTWKMYLCDWYEMDEDCIELPFPPLQSVSSVKYYDHDNVQQTLSTSLYVVKASEFVGEIERAYGATWPTHYPRADAIEVTFVCGFGAASDVPAPIKQALLLAVGDMWANRGDDAGNGMSDTARRLLAPYLVRAF